MTDPSKDWSSHLCNRADGSIQPERYGFAIGGDINRLASGLESSSSLYTADNSIDKVSFATIAKVIEGPLHSQHYEPTPEPKDATLLIVIFWGRSIGSAQFSGSDLGTLVGGDVDKINGQNAKLMGYDSTHLFDRGYNDPSNMMSNIRRQVHSTDLAAIEQDRYFIILQAFDFQSAWKKKKVRLLWETRFSLDQRRHDFGKDLPRMANAACEFFGQDTHGIITKPIPEGHIEIGPVKTIGTLPDK